MEKEAVEVKEIDVDALVQRQGLAVVFKNDNNHLREIAPMRPYYFTEVEELKRSITHGDDIQKGYTIYFDGKPEFEATLYLNHAGRTVLDEVQKTLYRIDGVTNEMLTDFTNRLMVLKHKEEMYFENENFYMFAKELTRHQGKQSFDLDVLYNIYEALTTKYKKHDTTTLVEMTINGIESLKTVEKQPIDIPLYLQAFVKSVDMAGVESIFKYDEDYLRFDSVLQQLHSLDFMGKSTMSEALLQNVQQDMQKQMLKGHTVQEEEVTRILHQNIEQSVQEFLVQCKDKNDIGIIERTLNIVKPNGEEKEKIDSRLYSVPEKAQSEAVEEETASDQNEAEAPAVEENAQEDTNMPTTEQPIVYDQEMVLEVLYELVAENKIKNVLDLTKEETTLVHEQIQIKADKITEQDLREMYSSQPIGDKWFSHIHQDTTSRTQAVEEIETVLQTNTEDLDPEMQEDLKTYFANHYQTILSQLKGSNVEAKMKEELFHDMFSNFDLSLSTFKEEAAWCYIKLYLRSIIPTLQGKPKEEAA